MCSQLRIRRLRLTSRIPLLMVFCLAILVAPAAAQQLPQPPATHALTVRDLGRATAPLGGPWQFHTGDDMAWASPTFDDSTWQQVQAGQPWDAQGHWGYTGMAWYRRRIDFAPDTPADLDLALYLPAVDSSCEVYWNGRLIGGIGKVPPHPVWYQSPYGSVGDVEGMLMGRSASGMPLGRPQPGVLAIRVWKAPTILFASPEEGGLIAVPQIGSAEAVAALETEVRYDWLRSNEFELFVVLLCLMVSVSCLLMGVRNRGSARQSGNRILLWLAVAMAFPLEYLLLSDVYGLVTFRWNYGLIAIVIGIYDAALWFVLIELLGLNENRRLVKWTKVVVVVFWTFALLDGALQLFDWTRMPHRFLPFDTAFTVEEVAAEFWGVVLVLVAFRRRHDAARWMLAICALVANLVQALDDLGGMGMRWTHWRLSSFISQPIFTLAGSPMSARTISNTLLLAAVLYAAWRYSVEQGKRRTALEQEYRSAQELQQVLIPEAIPVLPGLLIASAYRPAQEVGGDFFQAIALPGGEALLVIGDVSGKGLSAAMAVALIVGAIRSTAEATHQPGALLAALNRRLHDRLRGGFATCLVARIAADGSLTLSNAGHLAPYRNGEEVPLEPGLPLGVTFDTDYPESTFALAPGDRLTFVSDGVVEAQSTDGELFGFDRTRRISSQSAEEIAAAAQAFGQEDDITVLTVNYAPVEVAHA